MATIETRRPALLRIPPIRDYGAPGWFERRPRWVSVGGVLLLLVAVSTAIRWYYLDGQLWYDEANTIGIASHPLTAIPGLLWRGGGAPLYFFVLHVWMAIFGDSEIAVHSLSLVLGVLTVPIAMWLGFGLYGRRIGFMLAMLFAFSAYVTKYAEEARPYELLALLGLLATFAYLHVIVHRHRRGWLPALAVCLALLVYTDAWGFFFWAGAAVATAFVWWRSDDRPGVRRDALIAFGVASVLYLPWLPTLVHQAASATAPWHYIPLVGSNPLRNILGSDRVTALLAIAVLVGCLPLLAGPQRRGREATAVWAAAVIALAAGLLAWIGTLLVPTLAGRYLGPLVAPLLFIATVGLARSGILGLVVLFIACSFVANGASFIPDQKSDMSDIAAAFEGQLRRSDMVLVIQPEQAPLAWYYMPAGLRYATAFGLDPHPSYTDWDNAQTRLQDANPASVFNRVLASLAPGQRLAVIRPLTEGADAWDNPWSSLVRLRAAQWTALISHSPQLSLYSDVYAPPFYRSACCIASSALIYVKR